MSDTNPVSGASNFDAVAAFQGILEAEAPQEIEQEDPVETEIQPEETEASLDAQPEDDGMDEVEYEGNAYRVPKELKDALLRQSDYTRKTQEVAEMRRAVEAQQEQLKAQELNAKAQAEFQQTAMGDMAEIRAAEKTIAQFEQVNWSQLSDSDPVEAQKLWFQYQQTVQQHQKLSSGLQQKYMQFQQQQQQRMQEAMQNGMEAIKKDIPNWSPETAKELREAGKTHYGFTDAELGNVYDPRFVKLLADASAYRKLKASQPEVNKRVANAPKTVQQGAQVQNKLEKANRVKGAMEQLKKGGKVEDAAAVFLARMK